jgi:hypothetical protein
MRGSECNRLVATVEDLTSGLPVTQAQPREAGDYGLRTRSLLSAAASRPSRLAGFRVPIPAGGELPVQQQPNGLLQRARWRFELFYCDYIWVFWHV